MQPPTIPADLRLRTHLLVWGARVLVIGAGGLLALLAYLNTLAALYPAAPELAAARFHRLTLLVAGVLVVLTSGVAGLCSFLAMRILHTGHYPPPGMHVIRETPLRTGRPARRVAFLLWALAVVVFLCGMGLSSLSNKLLNGRTREHWKPEQRNEKECSTTLLTDHLVWRSGGRHNCQ
jgi:hypothetical protein